MESQFTTVMRPRSDEILKDETKKNADNLTVFKDDVKLRVHDNPKDFQDAVKAMVAETENKKPEENNMDVPSGLLKFPVEVKKPNMTYEEAYDIMIHGRTHLFNCAIGPSYPQGPDLYKMDSTSFDPIFNKIIERPYPASVTGPPTDGENSEFFCFFTEQFSPAEELNPILWKELALKALEHKQLHNTTESDTLELFGEVNAVVAFGPKFVGFHLDFKAKYRNNGLSKIMFAEALREKTGNITITFCDIIDPQDPGLVKGCTHCPRGILHPQGFRSINTTGEANPVGWWMGRRNPRRRW